MHKMTAFFIVAGAAAVACGQVAFYPLNGLDASTPSGAAAISGDGRFVVGYAQLAPGEGQRALRWTLPNPVPQNLTPTWPSGGTSNTNAAAVSYDGSVVVGDRQNNAPTHAFALETPPGTLSSLPELSTTSSARVVSSDGRVIFGVGGSDGVLRWVDRVPTSLALPVGATFASPAATTPDGGTWVGYATINFFSHAVRWSNGVYEDLGIPNGFVSSKASAITADGSTIFGTATRANQYSQGWVRDHTNTYIMLRGPHGETITNAAGATPDGRVIVGAYVPTTPLLFGACIWVDGVAMDVRELLVAGGANLTGWDLTSVRGVSDDGTVITGVGNLNNIFRPWAARIVLPPRCNPDVNEDGNADQSDIDYLINVVAGGDNPTNINPDFNADGNVDQSDIDALINVVAGGICP